MSQANVFSLRGKTALITGGASGLGFAIAQCMVSSGANVIITSRHKESAQQAADALGPRAAGYAFDIADTQKTEQWVEQLLADHDRIDIVVNNAGNHCKKPIEEMSVADFEAIMDVHIVGAFALTKALVPHMKHHGKGNILFMASMASFIGVPYVAGYSAAKSACVGLVRALTTELADSGIRVNGIAPGWIDTPMLRKAIAGDTERRQKILNRTPMKKFGTPQDIGWAAVYLASDAAAFVSGHVLVVDGGALIGF